MQLAVKHPVTYVLLLLCETCMTAVVMVTLSALHPAVRECLLCTQVMLADTHSLRVGHSNVSNTHKTVAHGYIAT